MVHTIEEVILALKNILGQVRQEKSAFGYFPSVYLRMTESVKAAILRGEFSDNDRMQRLCVNFANRYLDALNDHKQGKHICRSWTVAFTESKKNEISVFQHLLCGINAHINYDLGISASQICPGNLIDGLQGDFNHINDLIATLLDEVQLKLGRISWPMRWIDRIGKNMDEKAANFSMKMSRDAAWKVATDLAHLPQEMTAEYISNLDQRTAWLGNMVAHPGMIANLVFRPVKWFEPSDPVKIMNVLYP